ncbi:MAG: hypothetical protein OHK0028_08920 [Deltaproteobacteria bacterium]
MNGRNAGFDSPVSRADLLSPRPARRDFVMRLSLSIVLFAGGLAAGPASSSAAAAGPASLASSARAAIREQFREQAGIPGSEVFVGEVRFSEPAGLRLPVEVIRVAADGAVRSGRGIPVSVYVRDAGGEPREIRGSADVSIRAPVVVTARNVPAGAIVSPGDFTVRMLEYAAGGDGVLRAAGDAVGKRARWQLTGGVPIRREYLEDPAALRRGDAVTIVAESGAVRITGKGIALQAGGVGDTVLVRNVASGKETAGRLAEGRVVRVD